MSEAGEERPDEPRAAGIGRGDFLKSVAASLAGVGLGVGAPALLSSAAGAQQARPAGRKRVLAWADTRNGIAQHESVSHALSVIERLGYESGAYDTFIRTDSNIISKRPLMTTGA